MIPVKQNILYTPDGIGNGKLVHYPPPSGAGIAEPRWTDHSVPINKEQKA